MAFGLSDEHDSPDVVEDPNFGEMKATITIRNKQGNFEYKNLPQKPCT